MVWNSPFIVADANANLDPSAFSNFVRILSYFSLSRKILTVFPNPNFSIFSFNPWNPSLTSQRLLYVPVSAASLEANRSRPWTSPQSVLLFMLTHLSLSRFFSFVFLFVSILFLRVYPLIRLSTQLGISSSFYPSVVSLDSSYDEIHTGQIVGKHLCNGNKSVMDFISYIRIVCIICFVLLLYVYILYLCMYVCIDMYWRWIVTNYNTSILFIICKLLYISNYKYYRL